MKIFEDGIMRQSELLIYIREDPRDIITIDFDDTLYEKTGIFKNRFKIFETLVKSGEYQIFVLTSRKKQFEDIKNFINNANLSIRGIIGNIDLKGDFLQNIYLCLNEQNIICHFEDDIDSANNCVENEIPCFLTAESINDCYIDYWTKTLTKTGEIEFYEQMGKVKKSLTQRRMHNESTVPNLQREIQY